MSVTVTSIPLAMLLVPTIPIFVEALSNIGNNRRSNLRSKSYDYAISGNALDSFLPETKKINFETRIQSSDEIVNTMEKIGYQITMHRPNEFTNVIAGGSIIATWRNIDGVWNLNFEYIMGDMTQHEFNNIAEKYIKTFTEAIGYDVFGFEDTKGNLPKYTYETVFKDREVLIKTLEEHGAVNIEIKGDNVNCVVDNVKFEFEKGDEIYTAVVYYNGSKEDLVKSMSDINNEYCQNVQEKTYETIKERVEEQNLQIENEEVLEDDSILLTINLD